jgi:hypothetical protein
MDLGTIERRLERGQLNAPETFADKVRNGRNSAVVRELVDGGHGLCGGVLDLGLGEGIGTPTTCLLVDMVGRTNE